MTTVGGTWSPWLTRDIPTGSNEKAFSAMLECGSVPPGSGPPMALGGSEPSRLDVEAICALALTMCHLVKADPGELMDSAIAETDAWRLMVSTIAAKHVNGKARELLDAARRSYRTTRLN